MRKAVYVTVGAMLAVAAGLAGWAAWHGLREREPVYQGQRLPAWLDQCFSGSANYRPGTPTEAHLAVRQIGANALPTLLRMARARDSALKRAVTAFVRKRPRLKFQLRTAQEYRALSKSGFVVLGPVARPAVPALIRLLKDPDPAIREAAGFDLRWIGPAAPEAVPALVECLNDPEGRVRSQATQTLGEIHQQPGLAVPALLRSLERPGVFKFETINALAQFSPQAKAAAPALCGVLEDQADPGCARRCSAIDALERIGLDPAAVVAALTHALNDRHPMVREMATNFLLKYHPDAAAQAGLRASAARH